MPPLPQQSREPAPIICRRSEGCYASGCRDACCREAHRVAQRDRRRAIAYGRHVPVLVPAIGSQRRVQALATLGWTAVDVARRLGVSNARIHAVLTQQRVTRDLAERITDVYDALSDQPAPRETWGQRVTAERAIRAAQRAGWAPPIMWDDDTIDEPGSPQKGFIYISGDEIARQSSEDFIHMRYDGTTGPSPAKFVDDIAVERRIAGDPVPLTRAELSQAWQTLERMGWSAAEIGVRLGVSSRTVQRYRQRQRAA